MVHPTITGLRAQFAAANAGPIHSDAVLRRLPVPYRAQADYSGEMMQRYMNGLDMRLKAHMSKHAPRWHHQETLRILKRWNKPALDHPAPVNAPRRDKVSQASDYAAALLHDRMNARVQRLDAIQLSRSLDQPKPALGKDFHKAQLTVAQKFKNNF